MDKSILGKKYLDIDSIGDSSDEEFDGCMMECGENKMNNMEICVECYKEISKELFNNINENVEDETEDFIGEYSDENNKKEVKKRIVSDIIYSLCKKYNIEVDIKSI